MTVETMHLSGALGPQWELRAETPERDSPAAALPELVSATVPGVVHTDLLTAGLIPDPYLDLNETELGWIGRTVWSYRTRFSWDGSEHARTDLVFDGLDTIATITLNGHVIGSTANQHRGYRFPVQALLVLGENELDVRFDSAWEHAESLQAEQGDLPNAYPTPFNFIRKMAANFGWDWGPQLVTAGIWKPVRLESWSTARIDATATSVTVVDGVGRVDVSVGIEWDEAVDGMLVQASVAGAEAKAQVRGSTAHVVIEVPDAELWWPRGLGDQPLFPLVTRLTDGRTLFDRSSRRIGFRSVELDTRDDSEGRAFTIVVNGRPVFIRGANWIPEDCFPSRLTADQYRERIQQAADANLNLLRVWGGGIYESDDFYAICDELGILTWQDFLFACAAYPEEEPLRSEVEAEARENVRRIAGHPSLVLWNGCNENIWGWYDWGWQPVVGDRTWGLGYYTELLPAIVSELDPGTPYWPGSPFSGRADEYANDPSRGNMHIWDVWNQVDYAEYGRYRPRFVSEFGFQGPPTWSTLTESIHDHPLTEDSPGMLLHQKAADGNLKLERGMAPHLPPAESFEEWHYLTQLNQSRAIVFGTEHFRSLRPLCMGTIVWQFNDCWPVTSWAAVDGYGRRKPLWHGLRRANDPRLVTLQPAGEGLELVAVNDSDTSWELAGSVVRFRMDGERVHGEDFTMTVEAGSSHRWHVPAGLLPGDPSSEYLAVIMPGRRALVRAQFEDRDLNLLEAVVDTAIGPWEDGVQHLSLRADVLVRGVVVGVDRLEPSAWADDSDLDLLPGITTRLTLHTPRALSQEELKSAGIIRTLNEVVLARSKQGAGVAR